MTPDNEATKSRIPRLLSSLQAKTVGAGDTEQTLRDVLELVRMLVEDVEQLKSEEVGQAANESQPSRKSIQSEKAVKDTPSGAEPSPDLEPSLASKGGRPRTFDSRHALGVALHGYWTQGPHAMSLNEVCRRAQVSKPSLYREFGGEDGLLAAVLDLYQETVVEVLREHMRSDKPFRVALKGIVDLLLAPERQPSGCLLAKFRLAYPELGELTQQTIDRLVQDNRQGIRDWLERAKQAGEISDAVCLDDASHLVDRQLVLATVLADRGEERERVRRQLEMSLWCLVPGLKL